MSSRQPTDHDPDSAGVPSVADKLNEFWDSHPFPEIPAELTAGLELVAEYTMTYPPADPTTETQR